MVESRCAGGMFKKLGLAWMRRAWPSIMRLSYRTVELYSFSLLVQYVVQYNDFGTDSRTKQQLLSLRLSCLTERPCLLANKTVLKAEQYMHSKDFEESRSPSLSSQNKTTQNGSLLLHFKNLCYFWNTYLFFIEVRYNRSFFCLL
jgi:hypothetical protein